MSSPAVATGRALVVIGDRLGPHPYLKSLVDRIRVGNDGLPADREVQYVICEDCSSLALALREHRDRIALLLVGPGLDGKQDMIARLVGHRIRSVLVLDPNVPLADDPELDRRIVTNLRELGIALVPAADATPAFWDPIVREHVIREPGARPDVLSMNREQRAAQLDKRLESVTMFPSLPETQTRVAALDDLDEPRKWAAAINPDLPMKAVILNLLNSAHYSFRSRVTTIEQAVSLASARTIREVVLACTVQRLFRNVGAARIQQFWRHSVATGFFARILALPALKERQSLQEKSEFSRLALEPAEQEHLREAGLWEQFDLTRDGEPFTAGLLHDIGKVTIALCFEDALSLIDPIVATGVRRGEETGGLWADPPLRVERSLMTDLDHQIVGGRLARRWGLAPVMQEVVAQHHSVRRTSSPLTRLVALADLAANGAYSYPYLPDQHPVGRIFRQLDARVKAEAGFDEARRERAVAGAWPEVVESRLERVLATYDVPDDLWTPAGPSAFFRLAYRLRPAVTRLTNAFLKVTAPAM